MVEGRPMIGEQKESPPTMWDAHSGRVNSLLLLKLFNRACMNLCLFIIVDTN